MGQCPGNAPRRRPAIEPRHFGLSVKIIAEFEAGHPLGAVVWTDRRDYSQSAAQRADCAFLFDINVLSALEHGYQTGWLIFRQMLNAGDRKSTRLNSSH